MYTLNDHLTMLRDPVRSPAYDRAVEATVKPGDRVLDLGAGTGVLAFLALQAGAAHVYAIDPSDVLEVTRRIVRAAGYGDRVTCFQRDSRRVELPERVDVILFDLRGCLPILRDNLELIADARKRFLAPGGRLVPSREEIFLAPVEHAKKIADVHGWKAEYAGVDYSEIARVAAAQWGQGHFRSDALLAPAQAMSPPLDHTGAEQSKLRLETRFEVSRPGRLHGLGGWFESELAPGVTFSTAPSGPESVYGQAFFPLLEEHEVETGDAIAVEVTAHLGPSDAVWRWLVRLERSGQAAVEESHSSLDGQLVNREQLRLRADSHVPTLDLDGRIERLILDRIDGRTSLGEIARELAERHPERFATWQDALGHVGEISVKFATIG